MGGLGLLRVCAQGAFARAGGGLGSEVLQRLGGVRWKKHSYLNRSRKKFSASIWEFRKREPPTATEEQLKESEEAKREAAKIAARTPAGPRTHAWLDDLGMTPHANLTEAEAFALQARPIVYQMPLYGMSDEERRQRIRSFTMEQKYKLLTAYGCTLYSASVYAEKRLFAASRWALNNREVGVVTSVKRNQTVTVVVRVQKYEPKYSYRYWRTAKRWAHDEFNLSKLGDVVIVTKAVHFMEGKTYTVVQNYGAKVRVEKIDRAEELKKRIDAVEMKEDVVKFEPYDSSYKKALKHFRRRRRHLKYKKRKVHLTRRMRMRRSSANR